MDAAERAISRRGDDAVGSRYSTAVGGRRVRRPGPGTVRRRRVAADDAVDRRTAAAIQPCVLPVHLRGSSVRYAQRSRFHEVHGEFRLHTRRVGVRFTTRSGFRFDQIGYLSLVIDVDLRSRNNCAGTDREIAVAWDPEARRVVSGAIHYFGSCREGLVLPVREVEHRNGSREIALRFSSKVLENGPTDKTTESFNWFAIGTSDPDATGSLWDPMPNRGYHEARATSMPGFTTGGRIPGGTVIDPTAVAAGDLWEDLTDDIAIYRRTSADVIFRTIAKSGAAAAALPGLGAHRAVVAGDFDGAEADDLLFYEPGTGADVVRWYGDGVATTEPITIDGSYRIAAGDFDGDDRDDVLLHRPGTGTDRVLFGRSDRTFDLVAADFDDDGSPVVGDFNGDGRADIAFWKAQRRSVTVARGQSNRTFLSSTNSIGGAYRLAASGDFNADGRSDIVFVDGGTGKDAQWYGKASSPWFVLGGPISVHENVSHLLAGDFNGDGGDDLWMDLIGRHEGRIYHGARPTVTVDASTFPSGQIGEPYSHTVTASGIRGPYTFAKLAGPAWLTVDAATGAISGTPDSTTVGAISIRARDRFGNTASRTFASFAVSRLDEITMPFSGFGATWTDPVFDRTYVTGGLGNDDLLVLDEAGAIEQHISGLAGAAALGHDADSLFVAAPASNLIVDLDRDTLALQGAIPTGAGRSPTSVAGAGDDVWFGYSEAPLGVVARYDTDTATVSEVALPADQYGWAPSTRLSVVANSDADVNRLWVFTAGSDCRIADFVLSTGSPVQAGVVGVLSFYRDCDDVRAIASGELLAAHGSSFGPAGPRYIRTMQPGLASSDTIDVGMGVYGVDHTTTNGGVLAFIGPGVIGRRFELFDLTEKFTTSRALQRGGVAISADGATILAIGQSGEGWHVVFLPSS